MKIDDKTFNNPVTVLGAWADYFEDLPTPSEQQSFDSTFLMLLNDEVDILTEIFTKDRQPMHEVTEEELSNCISILKMEKHRMNPKSLLNILSMEEIQLSSY